MGSSGSCEVHPREEAASLLSCIVFCPSPLFSSPRRHPITAASIDVVRGVIQEGSGAFEITAEHLQRRVRLMGNRLQATEHDTRAFPPPDLDHPPNTSLRERACSRPYVDRNVSRNLRFDLENSSTDLRSSLSARIADSRAVRGTCRKWEACWGLDSCDWGKWLVAAVVGFGCLE